MMKQSFKYPIDTIVYVCWICQIVTFDLWTRMCALVDEIQPYYISYHLMALSSKYKNSILYEFDTLNEM